MDNQENAAVFEILFLIGNPGKISKEKNLSKRKSCLLHFRTEGCSKLKFGEVRL